MQQAVTDDLPRSLESVAIELARGAGAVLKEHFAKSLHVEYKDEAKSDPVSTADKASQELLSRAISERFPDHGILGEESLGDDEDEGSPAPDIVWVLDPLDGTKNYLGGMPVYAASVGVLHRGFTGVRPWPGPSTSHGRARWTGWCFTPAGEAEPTSTAIRSPCSTRTSPRPGSW